MPAPKARKTTRSPKRKRVAAQDIDSKVILLEAASKVGDSEVDQVVRSAKKIEEKAKKGPLASLFDDIVDLIAMVRAYANGSYREVPFGSIAAIVGALIYVLSPVDLIPDFIPGIGYVDDAGVVAACLSLVREDVRRYKAKA